MTLQKGKVLRYPPLVLANMAILSIENVLELVLLKNMRYVMWVVLE